MACDVKGILRVVGLCLGVFLVACAPIPVQQVSPAQSTSSARVVAPSDSSPGSSTADCQKVNIPNPAAVYCTRLGYSWKIVETAQGQAGVCIFPDGSSCDEWAFLTGKCGESFSYCAQHGLGIKTVSEGQDPFSQEYAVCTDSTGAVVGTVTDLSGIQCSSP
jgi:putative hemolysin